ncbi:hypothetical protein Dsin_010296 [Dipteronia sinensis]|uniref:WAT1-related protein n=1 Tax=Dipteronia sinensis TaxID=43782 RepID=A0AAE0AS64_9ROSI|nr:hypothetical protein Dsin_010296 [Dipteronia sinensis]
MNSSKLAQPGLVIWGQAQEEKMVDDKVVINSIKSSSPKAPLLKNMSMESFISGKLRVKMDSSSGRSYSKQNVLPFVGMVIAVVAQVSDLEVLKVAMSKGVNKYVVVFYAQALSIPIFLVWSLVIYRSSERPQLTLSTLSKIFLLAVFGMEKLNWRSKSNQAKLLGTLVSIVGAFVITFYKGPPILKTVLSGTVSSFHDPIFLVSSKSNWILGGLFLVGVAFFAAAWIILQYIFATILVGLFSLNVVTDPTAWKLRLDIGLVAVLYSVSIYHSKNM